jgi:hypothetical protein
MHAKQPGGSHGDLYVAIAFVCALFVFCAFLARRAAYAPAIKYVKRD